MNAKDIVWKVWWKDGGVVTYDGKKFANTFSQAVTNGVTQINKKWLRIAEVKMYDNTKPDTHKLIYHAALPGYDNKEMEAQPVPKMMENFLPTRILDRTHEYMELYQP